MNKRSQKKFWIILVVTFGVVTLARVISPVFLDYTIGQLSKEVMETEQTSMRIRRVKWAVNLYDETYNNLPTSLQELVGKPVKRTTGHVRSSITLIQSDLIDAWGNPLTYKKKLAEPYRRNMSFGIGSYGPRGPSPGKLPKTYQWGIKYFPERLTWNPSVVLAQSIYSKTLILYSPIVILLILCGTALWIRSRMAIREQGSILDEGPPQSPVK